LKIGDLVRVPDIAGGRSTDPNLFGKVGIVVEIPVPSDDFINEEVIVLIDYLRTGLQELWFDRADLEVISENR
tara:strand:- start:145 stop:363 length:219 start_codon:yes stop_codon:yes gene_type:complete